MKIIVELVDLINEELSGAKHYIKLARQEKDAHPQLSKAFADLAAAEMEHVKVLHSEVSRIIEEYRATVGEPPADMMTIYNYEHERHLKKAAKIKQMIAEYKTI